jgi:hypothetical protein
MVRTGSTGIAAYDEPMSRASRPFVGRTAPWASLVVLSAVLVGCVSGGSGGPSASANDEPSGSASPASPATSSAPASTASSKPSRPLNVPPLGDAASGRAYAAFLARLGDDRTTVDGLDRDLTNASNATDLDAVRKAAVAILDFVDVERDWLLGHSPADCYADAHASAMAMLEAYGAAADRFVDWSTTGGGLNGLPALGRAAEAAGTAQAALTAFTSALGGTSCPG